VATGSYGYEDDGRLTSLDYTQGSSAIYTSSGQPISYGVEYDKASNITQVTSADGTDNLGVDNSDQLRRGELRRLGSKRRACRVQ
jgi:hypothetical protein